MVVGARQIELKMQRLHGMWSKKDRRRDAWIETAKPGYGGIEYMSGFFEINPNTLTAWGDRVGSGR